MADPLIVIGGGQHARVIMDAALSRPDLWTVAGFVDALACEETVTRMGVPRLGTDQAMAEAIARFPRARFVVGIGAIGKPEFRMAIVARYTACGARWATVVHRQSSVSATASIGEGTVVFARAVINTGARIGNHCVINSAAVVEHDVMVGDYTQIAPAAAIGGGATIGASCYLGLGSRVRDHIRIGNGAFVAMGSAVVNDVAEGLTVMGVPGRAKTPAP